MFKSLRYRLLAWFLLSAALVGLIVFPLNNMYKKRKASNFMVVQNLQALKLHFLKDQNNINGFLSYDITNPEFYITGESENLNSHYHLQNEIDSTYFKQLRTQDTQSELLAENINTIYEVYSDYCSLLDSIVYRIYQRGYRDFGLEGEMISYVYKLDKKGRIPALHMAQLRLAEREYINRNDTVYVKEVNRLCNKLISNALHSSKYSIEEKIEITELLKAYRKSFNELVRLDAKIGIKNNEGLKAELNFINRELEEALTTTINLAHEGFEFQQAKSNILFTLTAVILVALAFGISIYTSRYLVLHLENLFECISAVAKNNFKQVEQIDFKHSTIEIRKIYKEFRNMVALLKVKEDQRSQALRRAEDNKRRYRELADLLPQSIYETDALGNLVYVNQAWFNNFGYTKDDLLNGINLIEILNSSRSQSITANQKLENTDFIAIRKDGSKFPASVYSDTIGKNGKLTGRRGIIIDSTLRNKYVESLKKEAKRAITSDKHKSSFLANMSHEIRTPMNSIIGFANLLSAEEVPEDEKKEFVKHIQSSGEVLLNLIDDIIDIAKIEAGEIKIKKGTCKPKAMLEELEVSFQEWKANMDKSHIKVRFHLPEEEIPFNTDAFRLRQILTNLISNAIKFTEEGQVNVSFRPKNQRMLEFVVEDTGIGMDMEELRSVFERFKRSKTSEKKNIDGTGLGLAISKNLVQLLGGDMWVSSESGIGTKFTFELPYVRLAEDIKPDADKLKELAKNPNWSDKTILVAEDDDISMDFLNHLLRRTRAKIIWAKNGQEAVDALNFHDKIDIVLMDIQLPKLNGYDATKKIKKLRSELPVIAQTAFAMDGDREKSVMAGCDDYITKPLNAEKLFAKMSQFINNTASQSTVSNQQVNSQSKKEEQIDRVNSKQENE